MVLAGEASRWREIVVGRDGVGKGVRVAHVAGRRVGMREKKKVLLDADGTR